MNNEQEKKSVESSKKVFGYFVIFLVLLLLAVVAFVVFMANNFVVGLVNSG
jgi:heme/copper-type cytochrome/quinol oxidase subunit 4